MSIVGATYTRVVHTQGHIDGLSQAVDKKEGLEDEQGRVDEMVVVKFMWFEFPRINATYKLCPNPRIDIELSAVGHMLACMSHEIVELPYEASPV